LEQHAAATKEAKDAVKEIFAMDIAAIQSHQTTDADFLTHQLDLGAHAKYVEEMEIRLSLPHGIPADAALIRQNAQITCAAIPAGQHARTEENRAAAMEIAAAEYAEITQAPAPRTKSYVIQMDP